MAMQMKTAVGADICVYSYPADDKDGARILVEIGAYPARCTCGFLTPDEARKMAAILLLEAAKAELADVEAIEVAA